MTSVECPYLRRSDALPRRPSVGRMPRRRRLNAPASSVECPRRVGRMLPPSVRCPGAVGRMPRRRSDARQRLDAWRAARARGDVLGSMDELALTGFQSAVPPPRSSSSAWSASADRHVAREASVRCPRSAPCRASVGCPSAHRTADRRARASVGCPVSGLANSLSASRSGPRLGKTEKRSVWTSSAEVGFGKPLMPVTHALLAIESRIASGELLLR